MSIIIDNNVFNIDEEDLDEIEYLEILSLDEIIKDNPSFIALSRDDIYNNLYELFKNKKKSMDITQLFYDILDNNNEKLGKLKDYSNYVFKIDADKNDYSDLDKEQDAKNFNNFEKLNIQRYNDAKNRYFFAIKYNENSDNLRFKPNHKITTELSGENKSFPVFYPVFPLDDVNLPLLASYYKIPTATINDYIYVKITSHLFNTKNTNIQQSIHYSSIDNLVKETRPDVDTIIQYLQNSFDLDYNNINNIFKRFGHSLDFISRDDFDKLCEHMKYLTKKDQERKSINRSFKIKRPDLINKKLVYFDKLNTTIKLLSLSEKVIDLLQNLKPALEQKKFEIINSNNAIDLKSLNIYDIIKDVNDGNITLEQVINRIKQLKHDININHSLKTIDDFIKTKDNIENIIEEYNAIRDDFEYARYHTFDYDKDGKQFVVFYNELKEILDGVNDDNYEGVPLILKNNDYEAYEDMGNIANEYQQENIISRNDDLEQYWLNIAYNNEHGFIELLKICLPMMKNIQKISNIPIDYSLLCSELFKSYRNIPTKHTMLSKKLENNSIVLNSNVIYDISRITPYMSLNIDLNMGNEIKDIIIEVNNAYIKTLNDAFVSAISWWALFIQEKILNNSIVINENDLNPTYVDKWFAYGVPLQNKEKNGVLTYLCHIVIDILKETNEYALNDNIYKTSLNFIEDNYKDLIVELRKNHEVIKEKKKIERGVIAQRIMIENVQKQKFDKIATDFINALLYMPGVNYKKLHKFLLGCCLQKIDKNFKADNDLTANGRKDLIDIKAKFAKRKETNKKRYMRFSPNNNDDKSDESIIDDIQYVKLQPYIYNINNHETIVDDWLDTMYNKNPLLPNNIIDEIKDNSRNLISHIEKHIKIIQTTSRNKNSDLDKYFVIGKINYKNILLSISKTLNKNNGIDDDTNKMIEISIQTIKNILSDLYKLNQVVNDDNFNDIHRINAYIISRAMCLPSNPDLNINFYLRPIMTISQTFIEENAKNIHNDVLNMLKFSKFPTMQENIDFINKKREENKQMKLNILNNKTVEENQLISNLKKAGIKHNLMKMDLDEIDEVDEINNEIYVNDDETSQQEHDFFLKQEDNDDDDDNMDSNDMGFIYSR